MKYSKEFLETNARLKTLDKEALNDELNKMTFDELLAHRDYMIREELGEENLIPKERRQEQIKKLQQMTREPSVAEVKPIRIHSHRTAKRIVALAAAIVVLISVFMVAAVASKRDFSILNGIVRFEDGKVFVQFDKTTESNTMTLLELKADLSEHGFGDVILPTYFEEGDWFVGELNYSGDVSLKQVHLFFVSRSERISVSISQHQKEDYTKKGTLEGVEGGESIQGGDHPVHLLDHGNGCYEIMYFINGFSYRITANIAEKEMRVIAETVV